MIDFNTMIDKYLHREFRPKTHGRYYPSEIGSCLRKVWLSYKQPKPVDKDLIKVFESGNILHNFVVRVLNSEKTTNIRLIASELPFKAEIDDFIISGRVDNLLIIEKKGQLVLVEVKSSKSIDYIKEPGTQHESQLQLYMHFLEIHNGVLLYIDKTTLQTKVFSIDYKPEKALLLVDRFKHLHKALLENTLPDPEAKVKREMSWMCNKCQYKDECEAHEKPKEQSL